jgi:hypothetical protein
MGKIQGTLCISGPINVRKCEVRVPAHPAQYLAVLPRCPKGTKGRGHLSSERARRILFRQADLTEKRLETWNGAERVGHGIHV